MKTERLKQQISAFWKGWGWSLLVAVLVATSFRSAIADWNDVPTGSMKPTILEGDRIFVNKLAYDLKIPFTTKHLAEWDDPKRGDIVVFYSPVDGKRLVKRVVGIPGDMVAMWNNRILLNGEPLQYDTLDAQRFEQLPQEELRQHIFFTEMLPPKPHPVMFNPAAPMIPSFAPIIVPAESYFMMGDNRDNSADSRFFGFVERQRIVGKATAIALSFDYAHYFLPRWNRFFSKL
ncbi:signal peptidase I [Candidatus Moduliflexus flocculans]|uniref:Signal peptidase I n=1 Tax=Candidatus Moduliflexus flocculans TaxID=1499966 RepID=A0A081BPN8_9BACT|nr:signal peptidase I [Candidatus Moduliflexus flocculans]